MIAIGPLENARNFFDGAKVDFYESPIEVSSETSSKESTATFREHKIFPPPFLVFVWKSPIFELGYSACLFFITS